MKSVLGTISGAFALSMLKRFGSFAINTFETKHVMYLQYDIVGPDNEQDLSLIEHQIDNHMKDVPFPDGIKYWGSEFELDGGYCAGYLWIEFPYDENMMEQVNNYLTLYIGMNHTEEKSGFEIVDKVNDIVAKSLVDWNLEVDFCHEEQLSIYMSNFSNDELVPDIDDIHIRTSTIRTM